MAEKTSYIRLDRNIIHWKWWHDHNTLVVFLYLLIQANIKDNGFSGQIVHRGEVVTSLPSLCNATGLTIRQVRTAISHLKTTGEVTDRTFTKFRIITIVNYDKYQDLTGKMPYKKTDERQASDRQATTPREYREREKGRKKNPPKSPTGGQSPTGTPQRGTDEFRRVSHLLLKRDEGTVDDIPFIYRDQFKTFSEYWGFRNQ